MVAEFGLVADVWWRITKARLARRVAEIGCEFDACHAGYPRVCSGDRLEDEGVGVKILDEGSFRGATPNPVSLHSEELICYTSCEIAKCFLDRFR